MNTAKQETVNLSQYLLKTGEFSNIEPVVIHAQANKRYLLTIDPTQVKVAQHDHDLHIQIKGYQTLELKNYYCAVPDAYLRPTLSIESPLQACAAPIEQKTFVVTPEVCTQSHHFDQTWISHFKTIEQRLQQAPSFSPEDSEFAPIQDYLETPPSDVLLENADAEAELLYSTPLAKEASATHAQASASAAPLLASNDDTDTTPYQLIKQDTSTTNTPKTNLSATSGSDDKNSIKFSVQDLLNLSKHQQGFSQKDQTL